MSDHAMPASRIRSKAWFPSCGLAALIGLAALSPASAQQRTTARPAPDFDAALQNTSAPQPAAAGDDFEAALQQITPPAKAPPPRSQGGEERMHFAGGKHQPHIDSEGNVLASNGKRMIVPALGTGEKRHVAANGRSIAPAGLLGAHWRGVRKVKLESLHLAAYEARNGNLDPFAFVEEVFGPVPLPQGFTPARCLDRSDDMIFKAGGARSNAAALLSFYLGNGFKRIPDLPRVGRTLVVPAGATRGAYTVQLELRDDAGTEKIFCQQVDPIAAGPIIRLRIRQLE